MVAVAAAGAGSTDAKVELLERLGERTLVYSVLADGLEVIAQDEGNSRLRVGDKVGLRIDGAAAHLFGPDGAAFHAEVSE
jgi:multiple sugar transport system ATP-binding protein